MCDCITGSVPLKNSRPCGIRCLTKVCTCSVCEKERDFAWGRDESRMGSKLAGGGFVMLLL